mgnify:CR=1 FL=1
MITQEKKIGIIDLGSNSVRLVIFEIMQTGAFRLVDDISETVRLSEGMIDGKYINDFAMRRATKTIKLFKKLSASYGILSKNIIAVATAAVRKAENRDQFLKLLQSSTGLNFKLLTGEEEALYVYKAVIHTLDISGGIIVDIGGGSTEIIKFKDKSIQSFTSIPMGAVVATEEYLEKDLVPLEKLYNLEQRIKDMLLDLGWINSEENQVIIGLGGTIRNFSKIHRKMTNYPLDISHNYTVNADEFINLYNGITTLNLDERKKIEGMSLKRADIIIGGLAILKVIVDVSQAEQLIVSGNGLREGLLLEYLFENHLISGGKNVHFTNVLDFSLENYMDLYGIRREHANHICHLSIAMFDQLRELHKLGDEERRILKVASLLHDIGIFISYYDHHKHSFYTILNSRINGLTHREIILVAAVAASHRKDKLKDDWERTYKPLLKPGDIRMYRKLSIFLKIAECLDRSETGIIRSLECTIEKNTIKIKTYRDDDAELELSLANENSELFKKVFNKFLQIT